jgi:hypothetical protein
MPIPARNQEKPLRNFKPDSKTPNRLPPGAPAKIGTFSAPGTRTLVPKNLSGKSPGSAPGLPSGKKLGVISGSRPRIRTKRRLSMIFSGIFRETPRGFFPRLFSGATRAVSGGAFPGPLFSRRRRGGGRWRPNRFAPAPICAYDIHCHVYYCLFSPMERELPLEFFRARFLRPASVLRPSPNPPGTRGGRGARGSSRASGAGDPANFTSKVSVFGVYFGLKTEMVPISVFLAFFQGFSKVPNPGTLSRRFPLFRGARGGFPG